MNTCTYSPEDNKIRIYPSARLDAETYARVKAAGFTWAPRQGCFVAGMWTPGREDLARELADDGIIDAEESTREERAAERAERFEGYRQSRERDAAQAHAQVERITSGIPLGQPILIGHHSQARAEADARKIEAGMRRAVDAWDTAKYWTGRAAAARAHADYLDRPDVRFRRIKSLEADARKAAASTAESRRFMEAWRLVGAMPDGDIRAAAERIANHDHITLRLNGEQVSAWSAIRDGRITPQEAATRAMAIHEHRIEHQGRWVAHYANRIAYERAMLGEQAGAAPDERWADIAVGGMVQVGREWVIVVRVTRKAGKLVSVSTNARYGRVKGAEEITDYRPPAEGDADAVRAARNPGPIVNVDTPDAQRMTREEWAKWERHQAGYARKIGPSAEHGKHRRRYSIRGGSLVPVFVTDLPPVPIPPPAAGEITTAALPKGPASTLAAPRPAPQADTEPPEAAAVRAALAAGVQAVSAPDLFPTPDALADEVIELAGIEPTHRVLEPSAGTGQLWNRIPPCVHRVAVEQSAALVGRLSDDAGAVVCGDFLRCSDSALWGPFDRIVMNPPFSAGADIKHIEHARSMLAPGGRIVAICADGPRQAAALRPIASYWRSLPAGTFAGTNVRAALLVIEGPPS